MEFTPLLKLTNPVTPSPTIFFVYEDPDQAYRVSEMPFTLSPDVPLASSIRSLCDFLHIPPLSSHLVSACLYPNLDCDYRRWLPLAEHPVRTSQLRLCCRRFSPGQLAYLSEDLLYYHFLTVKFDFLRNRFRTEYRLDENFHNFVSFLLTLDLCRILAKTRDENTMNDILSNSDLITSVVRKYEEVVYSNEIGTSPLKKLTRAFIWKKAPNLLQQRQLTELIKKIDGKHWTDFVIAYLERIDQYSPAVNSNRYRLQGYQGVVDIGANSLLLQIDRCRKIDFCNITSAAFVSDHVIELAMNSDDEKVCLEFETEFDAKSFATELSCYSGVLGNSNQPLFAAFQPSATLYSSFHCLGPVSISSDLQAVYNASALVGTDKDFNAIAFESSENYDLIGVLVVDKDSRTEEVRWYKTFWNQEHDHAEFEDVENLSVYGCIEEAAAMQLMRLMHLHPEADQAIQPNLFFDPSYQLRAFRLVNSTQLVDPDQHKLIRPREILIHGQYNTVEVARMGQLTVALKYARYPNHAVDSALDQSEKWLTGLKRRLIYEGDEAGTLFRLLLHTITKEQVGLPRCLILEYFDAPLRKVLNDFGLHYSLYHLLQALLDAAKAVNFLDKFGFVHGEISCEKFFVRQKPETNGFGELRVKLAEPSFHAILHTDETAACDDSLDIGKTFQEILFLSSPSPQVRESNQLLLAVNFESFFDNPNRYRPYLPRDPFQIAADDLQLIVLSLLGPPSLRIGLSEVTDRLEIMIGKMAVCGYTEIDFHDSTFDHRIYGCDAQDLVLVPRDSDLDSAKLGEGRFGIVFKVKHAPTGETFALKILKIDHFSKNRSAQRRLTQSLKTEINLQLSLQHPNIVKLRGFQYDRHGLITGILMSFHQKGSLLGYLKATRRRPPPDGQKIKWALQIAKGMAYLHCKHLIHRDLSARNILLGDDLEAKISDFGLAICGPSSTADEYPSLWWPPEWRQLNKKLGINQHDVFEKSGDVYSYGVLLWEIDNNGGHPKFDASSEDDSGYSRSLLVQNAQGSLYLQDFIDLCTALDADVRPTFNDLAAEYKCGYNEL